VTVGIIYRALQLLARFSGKHFEIAADRSDNPLVFGAQETAFLDIFQTLAMLFLRPLAVILSREYTRWDNSV